MAEQKGREMLLEIWTGSAYVAIAGITAKRLAFNNNLIDITTPNASTPGDRLDAKFMEGIHSMEVSGDIVFEDDAAFGALETVALAATPSEQFRLTIPSLATYTATMFVESLEYNGEMEGAVTATVSLKTSGVVTRAAI